MNKVLQCMHFERQAFIPEKYRLLFPKDPPSTATELQRSDQITFMKLIYSALNISIPCYDRFNSTYADLLPKRGFPTSTKRVFRRTPRLNISAYSQISIIDKLEESFVKFVAPTVRSRRVPSIRSHAAYTAIFYPKRNLTRLSSRWQGKEESAKRVPAKKHLGN